MPMPRHPSRFLTFPAAVRGKSSTTRTSSGHFSHARPRAAGYVGASSAATPTRYAPRTVRADRTAFLRSLRSAAETGGHHQREGSLARLQRRPIGHVTQSLTRESVVVVATSVRNFRDAFRTLHQNRSRYPASCRLHPDLGDGALWLLTDPDLKRPRRVAVGHRWLPRLGRASRRPDRVLSSGFQPGQHIAHSLDHGVWPMEIGHVAGVVEHTLLAAWHLTGERREHCAQGSTCGRPT